MKNFISNIIDKRKEFSYRVLPNGATRVITSLGFSFETDRESNAAFIVKACNEYPELIENNGLLAIDLRQTRNLLTSCEDSLEKRNSEYDKLKEQREELILAAQIVVEKNFTNSDIIGMDLLKEAIKKCSPLT